MEKILLSMLPILLALLYKILDYLGFWGLITNRNNALAGIERLKSGHGYPASWIFNDDKDKKEFLALYKRIKRSTKNQTIKEMLDEGNIPSLISIAGNPIKIDGVYPEWPLSQKISYTADYPIMLIFNISREGGNGNGDRCCSLGELENWINDEKRTWDFWAGVVVLSILSITFTYLQTMHDL